MKSALEQFVPKVHPLDRELLADDPMELTATPVMGDPEYMLQCMIEEYVWMGWSAEDLFGLFQSPHYPVLQDLLRTFGEQRVRREIEQFAQNLGGVTFSATVDETPEPDADDNHEPELIQLTVRRRVADQAAL
jgi:hypothetical protein